MQVPELLRLVGTWQGQGRGHFPTIEDFSYEEEFVVTPTPGPLVATRQRTWIDGVPKHVESGYLRWVGEGHVEWVLAHPTGLAEVGIGTLVADTVAVEGDVHVTPTATTVHSVRREYRFSPDFIEYDLWMATDVVPMLTHHLSARLQRIPRENPG
jgi:hypothetical protein